MRSVGLIVGGEVELAKGFEVIIQSRNVRMKHINSSFPEYMALQCPVFLLYGEDGYHGNMYETDDGSGRSLGRITMCDYYRFYLQFRKEEWSSILFGSRLKQQFEVDAYCSVEAERLE